MITSGYFSENEEISFRIQTAVKGPLETDVSLKLLFSLPISYPSTLPSISVHSEQLTRTQCMVVKERLLEEAKRHFSQPMVHELILWIQENLKYIVEQEETSAHSRKSTLSTKATTNNGVSTILLHLDHMRAKGKYVKTVEKWCADLRLTGRVMFMGKMIFILLQGDKSSIKVQMMLCVVCSVTGRAVTPNRLCRGVCVVIPLSTSLTDSSTDLSLNMKN